MIPNGSSNSNNNSNVPVAPGVIVNPGTPFSIASPTFPEDNAVRFLPSLSYRRSVLSGGRPISDLPVYDTPAPIKQECLQEPCIRSFIDPHGNPNRSSQLNQRGRVSGSHLLRPPNSLNPVSPTFSDVSSVRLTPRSPNFSRYCNSGCPASLHEIFKTPEGSRKNSLTSRQLHQSFDLDDAVLFPLYPPIQSYSPYLSSPLLSSPQHVLGSRKRTLSVSPFSDLADLNTMRGSPNSLSITGNSPFQPGSVGHLIGHLPSPAATPTFVHYQVQQRKTSIEHNHGRLTITNQVTFTEAPATLVPPTEYSYSTASMTQDTWSNSQSSIGNMVLSGPGTMDTDADVGGTIADTTDISQMEITAAAKSLLCCRWKDCSMAFEDQDDLVRHIEKAHVEPKRSQDDYVCMWEKCSRSQKPFNARYKLLIHMRTHSGEKPNHCTFPGCDKAFSRMENLRIHLRSHTGERPYPCQFPGCSKTFSNSSDRSKHQRTHYDQKPYGCSHPGCTKKYTDPSSLRKHVRTHTQPRKRIKNDEEDLNNILTVQPIQKTNKGKPLAVIHGYTLANSPLHPPAPEAVTWPQYTDDQGTDPSYSLQPLTPQCSGPYMSLDVFPSSTTHPLPHPLPHPAHPPPPYSSH